jgi:hypothetical protein
LCNEQPKLRSAQILYNKLLAVQVKNSFAPKSGKYNRRCPKYRQTARWHLSHFFLNTQQLNVKKRGSRWHLTKMA